MKIIALITSVFCFGIVISQNSYYFSEPLPSSTDKVASVDPTWFGTYTNSKTAYTYEFTETGVSVISVSISSLSSAFIRESSVYSVKNGFIFGVVENDSLPCMFENDRYYFGVKNKEILIGNESTNVLTKLSPNTYLINYEENGSYLPTIISFNRGKMTIKEFDYDPEQLQFAFVSQQKQLTTDNQQLIILTPNSEEFNQLNTPIFFVPQATFSRKKR